MRELKRLKKIGLINLWFFEKK